MFFMVLIFHHSVMLCWLIWNSWNFTCMLMIWKLTTVGRGICAHSVNSDLRKSHANLLRLNPAKSIVLPICKVPLWHFFLVTLSSRQRTVVLLLTIIWVEVIILVLSVVRSMRTSMIYDRLRILIDVSHFAVRMHFIVVFVIPYFTYYDAIYLALDSYSLSGF
jgi:hypothetical protein